MGAQHRLRRSRHLQRPRPGGCDAEFRPSVRRSVLDLPHVGPDAQRLRPVYPALAVCVHDAAVLKKALPLWVGYQAQYDSQAGAPDTNRIVAGNVEILSTGWPATIGRITCSNGLWEDSQPAVSIPRGSATTTSSITRATSSSANSNCPPLHRIANGSRSRRSRRPKSRSANIPMNSTETAGARRRGI